MLNRGVNLWYWRINEIVELQKENNFLLKKIIEQTKQDEKKKVEGDVSLTPQKTVNDLYKKRI